MFIKPASSCWALGLPSQNLATFWRNASSTAPSNIALLASKVIIARSNQPIDVLRFEATRQILLYSPTGDPHANDVSRTMSEVEHCELKNELIIFSTTTKVQPKQ